MGNIDDIYGGNTLKAEDLPENFRGTVKIESASVHEFEDDKRGKERKVVVRFQGKSKGLALNVTNANMIAEITGSRDYERWPGYLVVMYRTMTEFGGRRVPAIRIDHPNTVPAPPRQAPPPPPPPSDTNGFQATDDDVPF